MSLRVVVLSSQSLLATGIASRLSERPDIFDVRVIDVRRADAPRQLRAASPAIVVVDATDDGLIEKMPIAKLLEALPTAKVMRLDCTSEQIQIFSTEQRRAHGIGELIAMMQDLSGASGRA